MYLGNHTHEDDNPQYFKILEIIGFSGLSFILGMVYQKLCNGVKLG
tara:strand:+ start:766 stop:903 length:138 start_codon:yes stop_codon:yes gene_type:complete